VQQGLCSAPDYRRAAQISFALSTGSVRRFSKLVTRRRLDHTYRCGGFDVRFSFLANVKSKTALEGRSRGMPTAVRLVIEV